MSRVNEPLKPNGFSLGYLTKDLYAVGSIRAKAVGYDFDV